MTGDQEPTHVYLSTACLHEIHDLCRQDCKYCGFECICACHHSGYRVAGDGLPGSAAEHNAALD